MHKVREDELLFLKNEMNSCKMDRFIEICSSLAEYNSEETGDILYSFLIGNDRYKKIASLKFIYEQRGSEKYWEKLNILLLSDDNVIVTNSISAILKNDIPINEDLIKESVRNNINNLSEELYVLRRLEKSIDNFAYLQEIYNIASECIRKEILTELILEKYSADYAEEIFLLLKKSEYAKIRLKALQLGENNHFDISFAFGESDGHIKKWLSKHNMENRK